MHAKNNALLHITAADAAVAVAAIAFVALRVAACDCSTFCGFALSLGASDRVRLAADVTVDR